MGLRVVWWWQQTSHIYWATGGLQICCFSQCCTITDALSWFIWGWEAAILAAVQAGMVPKCWNAMVQICPDISRSKTMYMYIYIWLYMYNIHVMDLYEPHVWTGIFLWFRAWVCGYDQVLEAEVIVVPDVGCGVFGNDPLVIGGCMGAKMNQQDVMVSL